MPKQRPKPRITFTLEERTKRELEDIAEQENRKVADLVRLVIEEYVSSKNEGQLRLFSNSDK